MDGDIKKIISYEDRDEKVVKVTRFYKLTKLKVPKPIADRKKWKKFGDCSSDGPGINPANSMVRQHPSVYPLTPLYNLFPLLTPLYNLFPLFQYSYNDSTIRLDCQSGEETISKEH